MTSMPEFSETDLTGFDALWQIDYDETQNFIRKKNTATDRKQQEEMNLVQKEMEEKNFELQKLEWQLTEREKELKQLYDELHRVMELNKKLDQQLDDYEKLCLKQQKILQSLGKESNLEPELPKFH